MYKVVLCGNRYASVLATLLAPFWDIVLSPLPRLGRTTGHIALYTGPPAPAVPIQCNFGIAPADSVEAAAFFKEMRLPLVTAGTAGLNTVTLSSRQKNAAVICLQRELYTLGGQRIDPAEYPLPLPTAVADEPLLYAAAVLLLCGKEDWLLQGQPLGNCQKASQASN